MSKKFFAIITLLLSTIAVNAASQQWMRFHCEKDTAVINQLLKSGYDSKITDPGKLMAFYGNKLLGTPYVAHTLECDEGEELLTINIQRCIILYQNMQMPN